MAVHLIEEVVVILRLVVVRRDLQVQMSGTVFQLPERQKTTEFNCMPQISRLFAFFN
jgi:hypothetical protein